ncbi:MAG: molybdopterin-dependent oxidoreductase [Verrucomicrobiales bacterium]|nr:molybdopterin-dependent oxidoreductase [Verrucomicrobiales bacterium]
MKKNSATSLSRRQFTKRAGVLATASLLENPVSGKEAGTVEPPFLTPAADFYDVSRGKPKPHTLRGEDLVQAGLTPESWSLEIKADSLTREKEIEFPAKVENSFTLAEGTALDYAGLLKMGKTLGVKYIKAIQCLNIAEPLGQGLWEGVPLRDVLRLCGEVENVRRIYYCGFHNNDPKQIFQSSVSYTQSLETRPGDFPVILAYRLNGEPISLERGGPVRMIVPWAHGFKSIKWLRGIFLTNDYQTNDTYALKNNDPESFLKTAAYTQGGPGEFSTGVPVQVEGEVISGISGLKRVETWLRKLEPGDERLDQKALEKAKADWKLCELLPPPDWSTELPEGTPAKEILGFDSETGAPSTWPLPYSVARWRVRWERLPRGTYELYARSVDENGYAQPEPRALRKSGKNAVQCHRFEVI